MSELCLHNDEYGREMQLGQVLFKYITIVISLFSLHVSVTFFVLLLIVVFQMSSTTALQKRNRLRWSLFCKVGIINVQDVIDVNNKRYDRYSDITEYELSHKIYLIFPKCMVTLHSFIFLMTTIIRIRSWLHAVCRTTLALTCTNQIYYGYHSALQTVDGDPHVRLWKYTFF